MFHVVPGTSGTLFYWKLILRFHIVLCVSGASTFLKGYGFSFYYYESVSKVEHVPGNRWNIGVTYGSTQFDSSINIHM